MFWVPLGTTSTPWREGRVALAPSVGCANSWEPDCVLPACLLPRGGTAAGQGAPGKARGRCAVFWGAGVLWVEMEKVSLLPGRLRQFLSLMVRSHIRHFKISVPGWPCWMRARGGGGRQEGAACRTPLCSFSSRGGLQATAPPRCPLCAGRRTAGEIAPTEPLTSSLQSEATGMPHLDWG